MGTNRAENAPATELLSWLEQAARTTRNGITITDLYGKIVYTNPAEAKMHGYEVDELLGADAWILAPSQSARPIPIDEMRQVHNWRRESTNRRKDGSLFPVFLISDVVSDAAGTPVGMLTISEDLSEHKDAQRALDELESRYSQLAANLPGVVFQFQVHPDGRISFPLVSEGVKELIGINPEDMILDAALAFNLLHPEDFDRVVRSILSAAKSMDHWDIECRFKHQGSGQYKWVRGLAQFRAGPDGVVVGDGVGLDITTQKLAELELERIRDDLEARVAERTRQLSRTNQNLLDQVDEQHRIELELKHSNAILTAQQNAIDAGILVVNTEGDITGYNRPLLELWDLSPDLLRSASAADIVSVVREKIIAPDEFDGVLAETRARPDVARSGVLVPLENGKTILASVAPVKLADGSIIGRTWSFTDLTAQKNAERALERRIRFVNFVTGVSTRFINLRPENFDSAIDEALAELGAFAGIDRSYLFLFSEDGTRMTNTHEWCSEGTKAFMNALQDMPGDTFPHFWGHMQRHEVYRVPRVLDLPEEAAAERTEFAAESIQSILCVPMVHAGRAIGFVGFDAVKHQNPWDDDVVALLRLVGEVFSNALERNRNLAALRESENKFRLLFEASTDAVMIYGLAGFIEANDATLKLYAARDMEELRDKHPGRDLSPPTQPDGTDSESGTNYWLSRALSEGGVRFEWTHRQLTGRVFPAEVTLSSLELGNRQVVQAVVRDLTEQKRAENLLRGVAQATDKLLTNPNYEAVLDDVLGILGAATDVDRVYIFERHAHPQSGKLAVSSRAEWCGEGIAPRLGNANLQNLSSEFVRIPAWEHDMLEGKPVAALTRDLPTHMRAIEEAQDVKSLLLVPIPLGGDYWGFVGFDACREERRWTEGEQSLLVAMAASIGGAIERRRKDEAIATSESRWRALVQSAPDVIMNVDARGNITFINRVMEGYRIEEMLGVSIFLFADEASKEVMREAHRYVMETGNATSYEVSLEEPVRGQTTWSGHMGPIFSDGKVAGASIISRDITQSKREAEERLQLERKLLESQKLESLGVLAGGIAHDFNNLLMSVLGNAALALMDIPAESPIRETVQRIETAAKRAGELTQQLLAYSGKGRFVVGPLNLNKVIEEMSHLLRVSISRNVTVRYELAPDLPLIEGDATQLRQVVMNLITNASDAIGSRDGIITVSTGWKEFSEERLQDFVAQNPLAPGEYVYLNVADSGGGMDEDTLGRIFDPFFTTKFTGRGLGLAAVLGIVRGHDGILRVQSTLGKGTTFSILFPRCAAGAADADENNHIANHWRGSGLVLVIDDEDTVRTVTASMLRKAGFEVLLAPDGASGIEKFRENASKLAFVLLDMTMPNLSGAQTLEKIREIDSDARVVLMSGYSEVEALSNFGGKGLAGFLQKPFGPDDIRRVLSDSIEEK